MDYQVVCAMQLLNASIITPYFKLFTLPNFGKCTEIHSFNSLIVASCAVIQQEH